MARTNDVDSNSKGPSDEGGSTMHRLVARGAAYGAIVRGIVHEVRNPLQSIVFAAQAMAEDSGNRDESLADVLVRSTDRLSLTLEHLAQLFEGDPSSEGPVVLYDVVQHVVEMQSFNRDAALITIESALARELPVISGRVHDIQDALCILINVSIDAVGAGNDGRVTIQVARENDVTVAVRVHDTAAVDGTDHTPIREDLASGIAAAEAILGASGGGVECRTDGEPRTVLRLPCWSGA